MKFKPKSIVFLFLIFWIIFVGWGIFRTTVQLSKKEIPPQEPEKLEVAKPPPAEIPREEPTIIPISVRTFRAKPTDFSDSLPVMGTVKGETEIELRFEINGVIESINFREGETVRKGDLIASLNPRDAQLKLEHAKNKLASAEASYQSALKRLEIHQKLYEAGAIIKLKLEEVELECKSAKFQLETVKTEKELARNELKKTNLYAPFNGVMGPREAEEGEFVTPQDKVASLLKTENVLVEVGIVERDIHKIKLGQRANVYVDAYPNVIFEGVIENIFPVVEGKSRTLTTKIKVSNPERLLLPGMFSRAEILLVELKDALIIPSVNLISAGRGITLIPAIPIQSLEVDKDGVETGIVQLRRVSVGYITSDYAQITEGLDEGELVVIEARGELKDRARVRISTIEEMIF